MGRMIEAMMTRRKSTVSYCFLELAPGQHDFDDRLGCPL